MALQICNSPNSIIEILLLCIFPPGLEFMIDHFWIPDTLKHCFMFIHLCLCFALVLGVFFRVGKIFAGNFSSKSVCVLLLVYRSSLYVLDTNLL